MVPDGRLPLGESLALARVALAGRALGDFDIDLPPAGGSGAGFDAPTLDALGTLYLQAELELAGVIPAAEALAEARTSLDLPNERVAERLERFAQRQREWFDTASRNQLFARVFGTGPAATNDGGGIVNRDFEQRLVALCSALVRSADDAARGAAPAEDEVRIQTAIGDLLSNLELRRYGNTVFAARRIQAQLEAAIEVLKDPDVATMFHARGFWQTLQHILAPNAPDIARIVERGQAGQRLIGWIGRSLGAASGGPLPTSADAERWAAQWLSAAGLDAVSAAPAGSVR